MSHPQLEEKFTIELGVDEDGIVYEGDYGCEDKFKEIPIEEGLKIFEKYREFINAKFELENILLKIDLTNGCISFNLENIAIFNKYKKTLVIYLIKKFNTFKINNIIRKLECFQNSEFNCRENEKALEKLQESKNNR